MTLQNAGDLHLAVYNAAGKLVATLADGTMEAGAIPSSSTQPATKAVYTSTGLLSVEAR